MMNGREYIIYCDGTLVELPEAEEKNELDKSDDSRAAQADAASQ